MQLADYRRVDADNPFGGPVLRTEATGSTMADARALVQGAGRPPASGRAPGAAAPPEIEAPPQPGTVLVAGYQSAGRGQGPGRDWTAPAGSSLMFTLCLPGGGIARPPEALPLRVALGTSWFLREAGYRGIAVKWPNDVLVSGRKICGILCHHVADWFLVGVGLNVNQRSFPADLRRPATSLVLEGAAASRTGAAASRPGATASRPGATAGADGSGPPEIDAQSLLEPLLGAIARALDTGPWREELLPLLAGIGEEVQIAGEAPDYPALGLVIGIDQGGALLVQLHESGRVEAVYSRDRLEWRKKI